MFTVSVNHTRKLMQFHTSKMLAQSLFVDYDEWGSVVLDGVLYDYHIIYDEHATNKLRVCLYCDLDSELVLVPYEYGVMG